MLPSYSSKTRPLRQNSSLRNEALTFYAADGAHPSLRQFVHGVNYFLKNSSRLPPGEFRTDEWRVDWFAR
jgi:hypothetical protein